MKKMKAYILNTGKLTNDSNLTIAHDVLGTADNKQPAIKWLDVPTYTILIDHPTEGWIMYDIGSPADANERWPLSATSTCIYSGDETTTIKYQLGLLGLEPKDIQKVIMSHMHMDHIGNIDLFKDTAEFYVSRLEAANALLTVFGDPDPNKHGFYSKEDVTMPVKKLHYIDKDMELFPGIEVVILPGHTPGVLGMVIHLESGTVIATSDAINTQRNYDGTLPGVIYDTLGFYRSLERLKELQEKYAATVWFAHDMEQFNEMKKIPDFYE